MTGYGSLRAGKGLCGALTATVFSILAGTTPALGASPNILFVIADDMGLDASPCHPVGANKPKMAFLEKLCAEGLVFDQAYAAPTCSPSRATFLTGRYGFRTGVGTAQGPRSPDGLSLDETTIFQVLDDYAPARYAHAVVGKWHLATQENGGVEHPSLAGVDYYSGVIAGTVEDYYSWPHTRDGRTEAESRYITSALTDEAIDWTQEQQTPWFLWLAHVAPHSPFHVPPADLLQSPAPSGAQRDIRQNPQEYYFAALEALDSELERLVTSHPEEERENLTVIFIGDNGSPSRLAQRPYQRGHAKGTLYQGGVHVPLIVWGAGVTRRGEREAALVNSTDLFATIAELAGISAPAGTDWPEDSISFAPLLQKSGKGVREWAYVEHFGSAPQRGDGGGNQFGWAITDGTHKLIRTEGEEDTLFDIAVDEGESVDLLEAPAVSSAVQKVYERLLEQGLALRSR